MNGEVNGESLVAAFARWAAAERVASEAGRRARQRWIANAATSSATFAGVLVDLAEQRTSVTMSIGSQKLTGGIAGVGRDFCVVSQTNGRPAVVPLSVISTVWPGGSARAVPSGDREGALHLSFAGALASLAEERSPIAVRTGGVWIEGDLIAVGEDLLTVRTAASAKALACVPLSAVTFCEIR